MWTILTGRINDLSCPDWTWAEKKLYTKSMQGRTQTTEKDNRVMNLFQVKVAVALGWRASACRVEWKIESEFFD